MEVTYGSREGPHFTEWRFDRLRDLAEDLNQRAGIQQFHIRYDADGDWHILEFEHGGHKYWVQHYKIMTLHREGEKEHRYFQRNLEATEIVRFFTRGKDRWPWPGYVEESKKE